VKKFWGGGAEKLKLRRGERYFCKLSNEMEYRFTKRWIDPWVNDILDSSVTSK